MSQLTLAEFIEKHKTELLREQAVQIATNKWLPYSFAELDLIEQHIQPLFDTILGYLHSGQLDQFSQRLARLTQAEISKGISIEQMKTIGVAGFDLIRNLIDRELPGPENERIRTNFKLRLSSIDTMGALTAINTNIKQSFNRSSSATPPQ